MNEKQRIEQRISKLFVKAFATYHLLEDDDHDVQTELYVVDDDMVMIDPELMKNLDKDLDSFFEEYNENAEILTFDVIQ